MVEKIKAVNNPLTIVAIFAALAEIAGTVALGVVDKSVQPTFIWFVMGFPLALVLLFFATLNFNPKVLYAPSDFQNEENFLKMIEQTRGVSVGLNKVTDELENAKAKISALGTAKNVGEVNRETLNSLKANLSRVESELGKVREKAAQAARFGVRQMRLEINPTRGEEQRARRAIRALLANRPDGATLHQLVGELRMDPELARRCMRKMEHYKLVLSVKRADQTFYCLNDGGNQQTDSSAQRVTE